MDKIVATDTAKIWVGVVDGEIVAQGITRPGETTAGPALIAADSEIELLATTVDVQTDYNPLPEIGEWVEAGVFYSYDGSLLYVRQSHNRTEHDPRHISMAALFAVYREDDEETIMEWVSGEYVTVGMRRRHAGQIYILYNEIGANNIHPPPQVAAHWQLWVAPPNGDETPIWVSGEQLTYVHNGTPEEQVYRMYEGIRYRLINNADINIWPPPTVASIWVADPI